MTTSKAAMTAAELTALGSATAAALIVWLMLARPLDVVEALSRHEAGALAQLAFNALQHLLMRFIELL